MSFEVQPLTLEGEIVRLEPLSLEHVEGTAKYADPALFRYYATHRPLSRSTEDIEAFIRGRLSYPDCVQFAVVHKEREEVVGGTSYLEIRPSQRGLEIGMTWYATAFQGTLVNPECKLLLLEHAFDELGSQRVQLKTDAQNLRSRRGIEKLGAQFEGILRNHRRLPDGSISDTAMYSITPDEWPAVRARLLQRLGR